MEKFDQIVVNQDILGGKPCIKGTRISVDMILEWFATGATVPELIRQFPHLTEEGIRQALQYAAFILKQETFFNVKVA